MLKIKKVSEAIRKRVYTDSGDFFGEIEEANLSENKVAGWKIRISQEVSSLLGGAKGVVIPHSFIKAVGDIFIISKSSLPLEQTALETEEVKGLDMAE